MAQKYLNQVKEVYIKMAIKEIIKGDKTFKHISHTQIMDNFIKFIDNADEEEFMKYVQNINNISKSHEERFTRFAVDACEIFKAKRENKSYGIKDGALIIDGKSTMSNTKKADLKGFEEDEETLPNIDDEDIYNS